MLDADVHSSSSTTFEGKQHDCSGVAELVGMGSRLDRRDRFAAYVGDCDQVARSAEAAKRRLERDDARGLEERVVQHQENMNKEPRSLL